VSSNDTGWHAGYYTYWTNSPGNSSLTLEDNAFSYTMSWSNNQGCLVGGKGWGPYADYPDYSGYPGGANSYRIFSYTSNFNVYPNTISNSSYLACYGWAWLGSSRDTTNAAWNRPVVEYYILENFTGTPPWESGVNVREKGTYYANGSNYKFYISDRNNEAWAVNSENGHFYQYWSVRQTPRTSGQINISAHVNYWKNNDEVNDSAGFNAASFEDFYQVMGVEGNRIDAQWPNTTPASSGSVTVSITPIYPMGGMEW
jgi:endo-1,4-beta-xylanase